MTYKKLTSALLLIAFIAVACLLLHKEYQDYLETRQIEETAKAIAAELKTSPDDVQLLADEVRALIQAHSYHSVGPEFRSLWRDPAKHFHAFEQALSTQEPVPMECSVRSGLMQEILASKGIKTRLVDVYSHQPDFQAHTFLEVYNPNSQSWEISDPDINIYWLNEATKKRAGIKEIIRLGIEEFIPFSSPAHCGWEKIHNTDTNPPSELRAENYYSMARIRDPVEGRIAVYNPQSFDLEQTYSTGTHAGKPFCEIWGKVCEIGLTALSEEAD